MELVEVERAPVAAAIRAGVSCAKGERRARLRDAPQDGRLEIGEGVAIRLAPPPEAIAQVSRALGDQRVGRVGGSG